MIILKGRMAAKDAQIAYLKHELEVREREIKMLSEGDKEPGVVDGRIADLEGKIREMEALMKGLTEELLDLKTIVMKLHAKDEERRAAIQRPAAPPARQRPAPGAPTEKTSAPAGDLKLIMQADGTLKPEGKQREGLIVASSRYNAMPAKGKNKGRIVSEDRKKPDDLIYALEEEKEKND